MQKESKTRWLRSAVKRKARFKTKGERMEGKDEEVGRKEGGFFTA